jgi:hypothetical protein
LVCIRIDGVDFSFHAVPRSEALLPGDEAGLTWSGIHLRPIAPLVLAWTRTLRDGVHPSSDSWSGDART